MRRNVQKDYLKKTAGCHDWVFLISDIHIEAPCTEEISEWICEVNIIDTSQFDFFLCVSIVENKIQNH